MIVHEAARTAGFGAEIAALIAERALLSLLAPVIRVTGYDTVIPLPRLERQYMPSVERIVAAARKAMEVRRIGSSWAPVYIAGSGRRSRRGRNRGMVGQRGRSRCSQSAAGLGRDRQSIVEIPSPWSGTIARLFGAKGDLVKVGAALVEFSEGGEADTGTVVGEVQPSEPQRGDLEKASERSWFAGAPRGSGAGA